MIGLLLEIKSWIAAVVQLADFLVMGAMIAWVAVFARPLVGAIGVGLVGAGIMFFALLVHKPGADSAKIARLEAQNARLELKAEELRATGSALRETLAELREAEAHNEGVILELEQKLDAAGDNPECDISDEIRDAINAIK